MGLIRCCRALWKNGALSAIGRPGGSALRYPGELSNQTKAVRRLRPSWNRNRSPTLQDICSTTWRERDEGLAAKNFSQYAGMNDLDTALPKLGKLIEQRLALVSTLAESLESTIPALAQNDAEAIARGAAHQAELCRQWSRLECQLQDRLRGEVKDAFNNNKDNNSARLQAEWEMLSARIRYLMRIHCSLLRHLQRSLAVLNRVVDSCAATYTPDPIMLRTAVRHGFENGAGE
jgi:hypothetical protein